MKPASNTMKPDKVKTGIFSTLIWSNLVKLKAKYCVLNTLEINQVYYICL